MKTLLKHRGIGLVAAVVLSQLLSACVVLPLPYEHRRTVVVEPGYGPPPPPPPRDYRDPRWRR